MTVISRVRGGYLRTGTDNSPEEFQALIRSEVAK